MTLTVFVPGRLRNPLNGSHGHWAKHSRWARDWRERTTMYLLAARGAAPGLWPESATAPKCVRLTAHTHNRVDSDNLGAMLKPVRDGLRDARLIHDDGPDAGHTFEYAQIVDRKGRGVEIEVTECL